MPPRRFARQGVDVEFTGDWFDSGGLPSTEAIGLLAAVIVLLLAFGSVVAMGLPIVTALFGLGITLGCIGLVARLFTTPAFTAQVAAMIGIGVGIDYALFIVTRYRDALRPARGAARRGRRSHDHGRTSRPLRRLHRDRLARSACSS